jgi:hypothetical protein
MIILLCIILEEDSIVDNDVVDDGERNASVAIIGIRTNVNINVVHIMIQFFYRWQITNGVGNYLRAMAYGLGFTIKDKSTSLPNK